MKIRVFANGNLTIFPEEGNQNEISYVRHIIDKILFTFNDAIVETYVNGRRFVGTLEKGED